jgi:hypothetical protein
MSQDQAEKKKLEIEAIENQAKRDKEMIEGDACPTCGQRPGSYPYFSFLPSPYGWLECAACGTVYCPKSLRGQKLAAAKASAQGPSTIIGGV